MALIKSFIPADLLDSVREFDDKIEKPAAPDTDYSYIQTEGLDRVAGWVDKQLDESLGDDFMDMVSKMKNKDGSQKFPSARLVTPEQKKKEREELDAKRAEQAKNSPAHTPAPHDPNAGFGQNRGYGQGRYMGDSVEYTGQTLVEKFKADALKKKVNEDVESLDELNLSGYVDAAKASAAKLSKQGDAAAKRGKNEAAYNKFSKATKRFANVAKAEKRIAAQKWKETIGEEFQAVQPQPQRGPTQVEMDKAQAHIKKNHPGMKLNGVAIGPNGKINVKAVKVVNDVVEETELSEVIVVMPMLKPKKEQPIKYSPPGGIGSHRQGVEDAKAGKPYNNPHPFAKELGPEGNYDHNSYREGYHSIKESAELTELDSSTYQHFVDARKNSDTPKSIHKAVKQALAVRRAKEKIHDKDVDAKAKAMGRVNESINRVPPSHTIEAHGIKGMKRTPWRRTFKNSDHLNDWAEKFDAEVYGQRDIEGKKKSNTSD